MNTFFLRFMETIQHQGLSGAICFVLLYVIACLTLLPGSLLTLGAGAVYGVLEGTFLISIGSLLGSAASFLASRYLFRDRVSRWLAKNQKFLQLDAAVAREGWKIVLLSRLSPIFPFSIINYGLGLTRISLLHFLAASWIGTLPLIIAFVYAGKVAGHLATLGTKVHTHSTLFGLLQWAGFGSTLLLCFVLVRLATSSLYQKIAEVKS